jgi:hypothetical protein
VRSALQGGCWIGRWGGDFRRRLGGQFKLELLEQQVQFGLWLSVANELQLVSIGGRHVGVDHLQGGEFFEHAAWGEAGREGMLASV